MRRYLGLAVLVGSVGCSLLFNPDNISKVKPIDAKEYMDAPPPDTEIVADADHSMIAVTGAFPATINEGAGDDNSRPAIVVLQGSNFEKATSANLTVSITGWTGIAIVDKKIATDGNWIVLAVHVPVDTVCKTGTMPLSVTVAKSDGGSGMVSAPLPAGLLAVKCLDELTAAPTASLDPPPLYSRIAITTPIAYTAASGAKPAILRAVASIKIANNSNVPQPVDASALVDQPGPGGNPGGGSGSDGGGPGHGGGASGGGGGGAGFATAGTAGTNGTVGAGGAAGAAQSPPDPWISSYATNVSSGGGGGDKVGGGGGGTLELTAGGDLEVGNLTADGAAGTDVPSGITLLLSGGGGGTGGVILLRAGGMLTAGATSVAGKGGGVGRGGGGTGGSGANGRVRVDAASGPIPSGATVGPMFMTTATVTDTYPAIALRGTSDDMTATLKVFDYKGGLVPNMFNMTSYPVGFGHDASGVATATIMPALKIGYNKVCVFVAGNSNPDVSEGTNCIEIGYAP